MKKRRALQCGNKGMTMVEVLMGFVLLVVILGMLSGSIVTATNIYYSSVDLRRAEESLQEEIYKTSVTDGLSPESVSLRLVPASGMPGDPAGAGLSAGLYQVSSGALLEEEEKESLDVQIYFLRIP